LREVLRRYHLKAQAEGRNMVNTAGYDLVLNAKAGLVEAEFKQLEETFSRVMQRFHESLHRRDN
jgi:hypothetical protein